MLLEAILADGERHESEGVKQLMDKAGYPERTVKRAAQELGVEHERESFPAKTWWRLPVGPALVGPALRSKSGPTADSAQPSRSDGRESPVGPSSVEQGHDPTEALDCLLCGAPYTEGEPGSDEAACPRCAEGAES